MPRGVPDGQGRDKNPPPRRNSPGPPDRCLLRGGPSYPGPRVRKNPPSPSNSARDRPSTDLRLVPPGELEEEPKTEVDLGVVLFGDLDVGGAPARADPGPGG